MRRVAAIIVVAMLWTTAERVCARDMEGYLAELRSQGRERVCVEFEGQIDLSVLSSYGVEVVREMKSTNAVICHIDARQIDELRQLPGIKAVEPDVVMYVPMVPESWADMRAESRGELTALAYTGAAQVRWNNAEAGLNSKAAWDNYGLDGSGVSIAVIDTGVNYKLADLAGNYLGGADFLDDDGDPLTKDTNEFHGTEVTSLAVGAGSSQIVGVAHKAGFYALRVGDSSNSFFISNLISALEWAAQGRKPREDVISMSFGIPTSMQSDNWRTYWDPLLRKAIDDAADRGIVLVASSGNEGQADSLPPASYANVISVGAHNENQRIAGFSNGAVDIVAPGERVAAVDPSNTPRSVNGTSYAAPHVAGLIALQLQYARQHGMPANSGYHREVMKHGAVGLGREALWQGAGKLWAAATHPGDSHKGSLDLMALHWPIRYDIDFSDYAYTVEGVPVFYMGTRMRQHVTLTNMTTIVGNASERIEDLKVRLTQQEVKDDDASGVDPQSIQWLPAVPLLEGGEAASVSLSNSYAVPRSPAAGLKGTVVNLEFRFVGCSTTMEVTYTQGESLWHMATPGDLNLDKAVGTDDFAQFARYWRHGQGDPDDAWRRADLNQDRIVDWKDLAAMSSHWLQTQGIPRP